MKQRWLWVLVCAGAVSQLSACLPLVAGGVVAGGVGMVVTDRRTTGTQVEDQGIEMRAQSRVSEVTQDKAHVNVVSFNRQVLITGEVPDAATRERVQQAVSKVDNVRSVVNELVVGMNSSLSSRSNDSYITSKVKASLLDSKDVFSNATKVVTENGTVFLMGRLTQREVARVTEVVRSVSGVKKVVRVFEIITEDELKNIQPNDASSQNKQGSDQDSLSTTNNK